MGIFILLILILSLCKQKKYDSKTPVIRVIEGYEPEEFIKLFQKWTDPDLNSNKVSSILGKFDSMTLLQRPKLAAQTQLIDDGSGDIKIYRIDNNKLIELPKITNGSFFSGDSYIVIYDVIFSDTNKSSSHSLLSHVIYHWTGKNCELGEKQKGENLVTELCDRLGKSTVQSRITEDYEPSHFLQIFKGCLIVFNGKSIDYDPAGLNMREPNSYVLKVHGNSSYTSKASQVSSKTVCTSQDCFVIKTTGREIWVWCGNSSTGDSREIAKSIGASLGEYTLVVESNEPEEFWSALSEKVALNFKRIRSNSTNLIVPNLITGAGIRTKPALYISYVEQGNIFIEQVMGFEQKDMAPEDVYLLDSGSMIYIWAGDLRLVHILPFIFM